LLQLVMRAVLCAAITNKEIPNPDGVVLSIHLNYIFSLGDLQGFWYLRENYLTGSSQSTVGPLFSSA